MKNMKIGVYGSASEVISEEIKNTAQLLGKAIAEHGGIVVTGACPGLPQEVVMSAYLHGGSAIGFSPATSLERHIELGDPTEGFKKIHFIPADYTYADQSFICMKYRNVSSVAFVDAAIIIGGRTGTMNEFTIAYDTGKIIGVLENTGGITERAIQVLIEDIHKETSGEVIFEGNPAALVKKIFQKFITAS